MNPCERFGSEGLRIVKVLEAKTPKMKTWKDLGGGDPRAEVIPEAEDPKVIEDPCTEKTWRQRPIHQALETHLRANKSSEGKASRMKTHALWRS